MLVLAGCEVEDEDFEGRLVHVEIVSTSDDCSPRRMSGDAGLQFIGTRADGGTLFTISQEAVYGPLIDGGALESVIRQALPPLNLGRANIGIGEESCNGIFGDWVELGSTLQLRQDIPGSMNCVTGPLWLPTTRCSTDRTFTLTDVGTCRLSCIQVTASAEVVCDC